MSEQETFDRLRRAPIDEVDEAALGAFGMPPPFTATNRESYAIILDTKEDMALLAFILTNFHWDLDSYLKYTVIAYTIIQQSA